MAHVAYEADGSVPFPVTVDVDVDATGPEHVASLGPNNLNVIVPVGFTAPVSVALSETEPPTATDGEACVEIVGEA